MQLGGNRFFLHSVPKVGEEVELPQEEAHHLVKVLRKQKGEKVLLIDGKGKEYLGELKLIKKSKKGLEARVLILKINRKEEEKTPKVVVLMPLLKGEKKDFLVEKLTELGADVIWPFLSEFTEARVKEGLLKRFQRKAISATKQCGRLWLPVIKAPESLPGILDKLKKKEGVFICASEKGGILSEKVKKMLLETEEVFPISGPEGGFSSEESSLLEALFYPIKLSPYILRAETACISLVTLIFYHLLPKSLQKSKNVILL
jgi:16S rRNA (uracil1498-N3)-methyltransferase